MAEGQKSRVSDFFDRSEGWRGKFYREPDDPFGQMLVRRKSHVLRLLRKHVGVPDGAVFDAGCGPGEYVGELGEQGARIFGMDASEEMIRASSALLAGKPWAAGGGLVRGDIEHAPFRSGAFGTILCIGVLGYLERDEDALAELGRLLRPGGHLLLNVRNLNAFTSLHHTGRLKARHLRRHGWGGLRSAVSLATHTREGGWTSRAYNIGRLERLVCSRGFERIEGMTFGYEFKALGWLGVGGQTLVRLETMVENAMLVMPRGVLRRAGWGYVGVFRKAAAG